MKIQLNALTEQAKRALDDHAAQKWDRHLLGVGGEMPSVHHLCKQLAAAASTPRPLIDDNGQPHYHAKDRAELLADHLERLSSLMTRQTASTLRP